MKKIIVVLLVVVHFSLFSQESVITLEDFIISSLSTGDIEALIIDEITLHYSEALKVPPGNFVLSVLGEYQLNYESDIFHKFNTSIGLSKTFNRSGTTISGSFSVNPQGVDKYAGSFRGSLEQSIVKNAFGRITRIREDIAGNEAKIARVQIINAYETYIASVISKYFDWYSAYLSLNNSRRSLAEHDKLLANINDKFSYGIARKSDVDKMVLQNIAKQEKVLSQEAEYNKLLIDIRSILQNEIDEEIIPKFNIETNYKIAFDDEIDRFVEDSRTVSVFRLIESNERLNQKVTLDDLLPDAKFYTDYSLGGIGFGGTNNNLNHLLEIGISMNFNMPQVGFLDKLKKSELDIDAALIDNKLGLSDKIDTLYKLRFSLEYYEETLSFIKRKIELSESILKEEIRLYNTGNSSINEIISAYEDVDTMVYDKTINRIQYMKNYIEWYRSTNALLTDEKKLNIPCKAIDKDVVNKSISGE